MTAILVVLTIAAFLTIDWLTRRRTAAARVARPSLAAAVRDEAFACAEGLFYAPGHTWARLEADGSVRVGIDDFARRLLGHVDRIEVAPAGAAVGVQDAAVIVHQGTKSVGFAAPFAGVVEAVNPEALGDPGRVSRDPYAAGWLMVLRPQRLAEGMRRLRVGDDAARWMRAEVARLRDFLASEPAADPVGATLHDGGEPSVGVLEHLDTRGWERFESEFLAS